MGGLSFETETLHLSCFKKVKKCDFLFLFYHQMVCAVIHLEVVRVYTFVNISLIALMFIY